MRRLILSVIINGLALWLAHRYVAGFAVTGDVWTYAVAAVVLAFLNGFIKPVLKIIAFPLMLVTLGLFSLVINALLLWSLSYIVPSVIIAGLIPLAWATLVVTVVNVLLGSMKKL